MSTPTLEPRLAHRAQPVGTVPHQMRFPCRAPKASSATKGLPRAARATLALSARPTARKLSASPANSAIRATQCRKGALLVKSAPLRTPSLTATWASTRSRGPTRARNALSVTTARTRTTRRLSVPMAITPTRRAQISVRFATLARSAQTRQRHPSLAQQENTQNCKARQPAWPARQESAAAARPSLHAASASTQLLA